ncbi:MAG: SIS domain-containing protein [Clostridia bacterium]|nr:SIS domain-containing protein [Clostridia bacterium]
MSNVSTDDILNELKDVLAGVTPEDVRRTANCILSHKRVFVCGAGRTGLMLKAFAMRLMQSGLTAYVAGETVTPAVGARDLLFLATASGSTHTIVHSAEVALNAGADLFVVTAEADSAITALHKADVVLPAGGKDAAGRSRQIMGSLFEQALLVFCDAVVQCLPLDPERMRQRHANLE